MGSPKKALALSSRELTLWVRSLALMSVLLAAAAVPATGRAAEEIQDVEAVEIVEPADAVPSSKNSDATSPLTPEGPAGRSPQAKLTPTFTATFLRLLGHLHAAVIHLPIAWSLLWACTELAVFGAHKKSFDATGAWLSAATTLSFAPAVTSGLLRFGELAALSQDPDLQSSGGLHRNLMYLALALAVSLSLIRLTQRHRLVGKKGSAYALAVAVTAALIGFSAHLGGVLVYGADFFVL